MMLPVCSLLPSLPSMVSISNLNIVQHILRLKLLYFLHTIGGCMSEVLEG